MKKITIKVDESLIPRGYEIVAFREANADDMSICILDGGVRTGAEFNSTGLPALILKKKRWRADLKGAYKCIDSKGNIIRCTDNYYRADDEQYEAGNYYKPDSAEVFEAQKRVQAAYRGGGE